LCHKVADNAAVIKGHFGAICVEDAHNANLRSAEIAAAIRKP
jgi:hypothetical protein